MFSFIKYLLNKKSNLFKNLSKYLLSLLNLWSSTLSEIPLLDILSPENRKTVNNNEKMKKALEQSQVEFQKNNDMYFKNVEMNSKNASKEGSSSSSTVASQ